MQIKLSGNKEVIQKIDAGLSENHTKYGARFCPCISANLYTKENKEDYICPCKEFIESKKLGECHCGKYVKTEI